MNRQTIALAIVLAFAQTASAADPAIEAGLTAAGCAPFMKRLAIPGSTTLETPLYGKALGAWKTEDFQYMLDFGARYYRAELSESMAAREAEVLRGQINDRINEIRQRHQRAEAQREAERQMATAKADDYAIEPEPAAQRPSQGVIQDDGQIEKIENDFRRRYSAEIDNPNTSAQRLNEILTELRSVRSQLAYSPRLESVEMHINHQIKNAGDTDSRLAFTDADNRILSEGGYYMHCGTVAQMFRDSELTAAAGQRAADIAAPLSRKWPQFATNQWQLMMLRHYEYEKPFPTDQAGMQRLYDECADELGF